MGFTVLGDIFDVETFAVDRGIHERGRFLKRYGVGRKELKIKRYLD